MQKCKVSITTTVDGQENSITREGKLFLAVGSALLEYNDQTAVVHLKVDGERAEIERCGDYSMRLVLEKGKLSDGSLGIGDSQGEIRTFAHKINYSIAKNSLLLLLHYDLLIGKEVQKMKIRLTAKMIE